MLEDLVPPFVLRPCGVRTLYESLSEADVKILRHAVDSPNVWAAETLATTLKSKGLSISGKTITHHRKGACTCSKI